MAPSKTFSDAVEKIDAKVWAGLMELRLGSTRLYKLDKKTRDLITSKKLSIAKCMDVALETYFEGKDMPTSTEADRVRAVKSLENGRVKKHVAAMKVVFDHCVECRTKPALTAKLQVTPYFTVNLILALSKHGATYVKNWAKIGRCYKPRGQKKPRSESENSAKASETDTQRSDDAESHVSSSDISSDSSSDSGSSSSSNSDSDSSSSSGSDSGSKKIVVRKKVKAAKAVKAEVDVPRTPCRSICDESEAEFGADDEVQVVQPMVKPAVKPVEKPATKEPTKEVPMTPRPAISEDPVPKVVPQAPKKADTPPSPVSGKRAREEELIESAPAPKKLNLDIDDDAMEQDDPVAILSAVNDQQLADIEKRLEQLVNKKVAELAAQLKAARDEIKQLRAEQTEHYEKIDALEDTVYIH